MIKSMIAIKETEERKVGGQERVRVLVCPEYYLPGIKYGGPLRSYANMIAYLGKELDFYLLAKDRDWMDTERYPNIIPGGWNRVGNAWVRYCSAVSPATLLRTFREVRPDVVMLNGFQGPSTRSAMFLRLCGFFGDTPIVLAPHGEFSPGAIEIKRVKKVLYRYSVRMLGFCKNLHWHACSEREKKNIVEAAPARRLDPEFIHVAYNICDSIAATATHIAKEPGSVKFAFISRISVEKNLEFLLETLREIKGKVELNIFGPLAEKDSPYWESCAAILARLPDNIKAKYHGSADHAAVPQLLHEHHFFVLPTKCENFCHAAVESFVNGTPVILSNETPWINLRDAEAGFDISLNDREGWLSALQDCVDMNQQTYARYLCGAREYSRRFSVEEAVQQHRAMIMAVAGNKRDR